jgi:polysaccharide export outer membrane protein
MMFFFSARTKQTVSLTCLYIVVMILLSSCGAQRRAARQDLLYMQGNLDTIPNLSAKANEIRVQKGDILSIIVYSDNPEATAIYNQPQLQSAGTKMTSGYGSSALASSSNSGGYQVQDDGTIYFQTLGLLKVEGKTRKEVSDEITSGMKKFLNNPYTDVRFQNLKLTVLGEVQKPGVLSLPNEKVNILEVVGLAGDLTIYGKRDNILVIREINGQRQFGRVDLGASDVFQSPYFYLQPNDVVYVEPNSKKATVSDQTTMRNLAIVTALASLVSTVALLISIFQ